MVEASANAELVHLTHSMQHEQAADPNLAPPPPRPGLDVFAAALSQEISTARTSTEPISETLSVDAATQSHTTQPASEPTPPSPDATFRQTRLAVTVGLVVLLLVVWIIQRRSSARH